MTAPLFSGRPGSPVSPAPTAQAIKVVGLKPAMAVFDMIVMAVPSFLLALWFPFGTCVVAAGWIVWVQNRAKKVRNVREAQRALCPMCKREVIFWTRSAFACPCCHRQLMRNGHNLYAI